jgi:hypothetical protein
MRNYLFPDFDTRMYVGMYVHMYKSGRNLFHARMCEGNLMNHSILIKSQ